jgi:hypothetical protein
MWNADHNTMDALINILAMTCMTLGLVALYLCLTYPARRKR